MHEKTIKCQERFETAVPVRRSVKKHSFRIIFIMAAEMDITAVLAIFGRIITNVLHSFTDDGSMVSGAPEKTEFYSISC